eukprot:scaffold8534_cov79-Skeletonema_dohrnii-CCMP3373.AAC.5
MQLNGVVCCIDRRRFAWRLKQKSSFSPTILNISGIQRLVVWSKIKYDPSSRATWKGKSESAARKQNV